MMKNLTFKKMSPRQMLTLLSNPGNFTEWYKLGIASNKLFYSSNSKLSPAVSYDNFEHDKARILNENKDKSGVYRLTNLENGSTINPWFITGFTDGEGCFHVSIKDSPDYKTGKRVQPSFHISLNSKDKPLLELICAHFGVGSVTKKGGDKHQYRVFSLAGLKVIISHFDKYQLITQKRRDFELFKEVVELIDSREHVNPEGLQRIVNLKASMNNGLSDVLKAAFPDTILVPRLKVLDQEIKDPNWLAGFVDGEGCFMVGLNKSSTHKLGYQVQLDFRIAQHYRDAQLMKSLMEYLGCGQYLPYESKEIGYFIVRKYPDIVKIITFFEKYPLVGHKLKDFASFKKAADIVKVKGHLTAEGLEEIRLIRAGMNSNRYLM